MECAAILQLKWTVQTQRPGTAVGTGPRNATPSKSTDHDPWLGGKVRAADIMTTSGDALATNLAALLNVHPAMGPGAYVIWRQRIISADRKAEGWRSMPDRGSATANHMDHVHVSVTTRSGQDGYDSAATWGKLWTPGGAAVGANTAGADIPVPGLATTSASAALNGAAGAVGGVQNVALTEQLEDKLEDLLLTYLVLMGGAALIVLGAIRAVKPHSDALIGDVQSVAKTAATRGAA